MALQTRFLIWSALIMLFFAFIFAVKAILLPFVVGMLVAYLLDPAADTLEEWGFSRGIATGIITISFFVFLFSLLILLMPFIAEQAGVLAEELPGYLVQIEAVIRPHIEEWRAVLPGGVSEADSKEVIGNYAKEALGLGSSVITSIFNSSVALLNLVSLIVLTPVVSFYLLKDWDRMTARIDELLPRAYAKTIRTQLHRIDETLAGFIRGQLNVCVLMALYNMVALSLVGLEFAILIGLISGFLILLPYIGTVLTALLALGVAYVQFSAIEPILIVGAIFVAGQMIEGYFLTPKLVGERVGLHPVWVIFGMLAGAALFGFVGIFLAVPVTAVIGVLIRFAVEQYTHSALYKEAKPKRRRSPAKKKAPDASPKSASTVSGS